MRVLPATRSISTHAPAHGRRDSDSIRRSRARTDRTAPWAAGWAAAARRATAVRDHLAGLTLGPVEESEISRRTGGRI
jgi:hypothetical protein